MDKTAEEFFQDKNGGKGSRDSLSDGEFMSPMRAVGLIEQYHQSRLSELQEQIHGLAREIEDAIESQKQEELPVPDWLKGQLHAYNTAARKIREMMP